MDLYDPELEKAWCGPDANVHKPGYEVYLKRFGSGHRFVPVVDANDQPTGKVACWFCGLALEPRPGDRVQSQAAKPEDDPVERWESEGGNSGLGAKMDY